MSTRHHDNAAVPVQQEEDVNDANWNEVVSTREPSPLARESA